MRIAHRIPQSAAPQRDLDWNNLLGACTGNEGNTPTHCDVAQHDTPLELDPTRLDHCATLRFEQARLVSARASFMDEIERVLALNTNLLQKRRNEALDAYLKVWFSGRGSVDRSVLERMRVALESHGELPPYVSFLKSWLARHIRSR
ncbi:MAG: hypothetical protein MUF64_01990 [Polyangiaceae bacterium]|jgi:hypothetical protein|nr:hypothetical protein [Polyangiaceae bacterium]